MLLAIDCGNTNTVFSIWDGTQFLDTWRTSTEWQRTADQYYVWLSSLMRLKGLEVDHHRCDHLFDSAARGFQSACALRSLFQHASVGCGQARMRSACAPARGSGHTSRALTGW